MTPFTVELLSRVHDHTVNRFVKGFRMLTLGWSDGHTFVPIDFSLLSSAKKENRYTEASVRMDKRTVGYKRRQEAIHSSLFRCAQFCRDRDLSKTRFVQICTSGGRVYFAPAQTRLRRTRDGQSKHARP
jgi:hypothetical protein